jgi:GldM C-terminal domain
MLIKQYIPYLVLLLIHTQSHAQDSIPNKSNNSTVACALDRMNVFYIGVENSITIAASNAQPEKIKVSGQGCTIISRGNGKYIVTAATPGVATIQVSENGNLQTFKFRVKWIPNPIPLLSGKKGGCMAPPELCGQTGLILILENFDFEVKCVIQSFTVTRISRHEHEPPISISVSGGAFDEKVQHFICAGKSGDLYNFSNIKTLCPGDVVARDLGTVNYFVK